MGGLLPPAERRSSVLVALYVALSLLLLTMGDRVPQASLRGAGATLFAPLDHVVLAADRLWSASGENRALHERLTGLELENARLRGLVVENQRLRDELDLPAVREHRMKAVEVLALTGEPYPAAATLSAGRRHGVREGDAVVTSTGLVGRVTEIYGGLSRATLLTDPNAAVACEVESTGVLGVLRFAAVPSPRLLLTGVPFSDTVQVGQRLLTSGYSRRYPRGIPVGRVTRLGRDASGLTQSIEVQPEARLSRLRHVFVVPGPGSLESQP
ncbi:MAG TPA: rod shape-determining protein MreC [Candidatus Limnocylindria bacterium]|nr:rod shape-determining protein MreC [Candidatus Limnocylindria bacterium]